MKKLLFVLWLINFASNKTQAQSMLTNRSVYDFNVGDEFQTRTNMGSPPNANRYTILSKRYSANNDTVIYHRSFNNYAQNPGPPPISYNLSTGIDSVKYTNLDTLVSAPYRNPLVGGPCSTSKDTLYHSTQYCGVLVYQNNTLTSTCAEGHTSEDIYGQGIGQALYDYNDPTNNVHNRVELFYYKKGTSTCGTKDTLAPAGIQKYNTTQATLHLYPNPTTSNLSIQTNSSDKQTLQIINASGQLVFTETIQGTTNIDVHNLSAGVYNITITNNQSTTNKRLVIVK